jgi:MoxR-like ATPase
MNPAGNRIPEPEDGQREVVFSADHRVADRVHLLGVREIRAINAAIAAGRPLLVRGEPGVGKSQLARAAAKELGRAFVKHVVDSRTESRDLMWHFDAVKRLADAQLAAVGRSRPDMIERDLAVENYLHPGPLWWAFHAAGAECQLGKAGGRKPAQPDGGDWARGCVFLLDEIDKAEAEVPNGLLEALSARQFTPDGMPDPVRLTGPAPLVVITTNGERVLPYAFLRRCFVLRLSLPPDDAGLTDHLMQRGEAHFPGMDETVRRTAAEMLLEDRRTAEQAKMTARPGQAEYLDLLRAVRGLAENDADGQLAMLRELREYTLGKHAADDDFRP